MPVDTKRITIPEDSCHPSLFAKEKETPANADIKLLKRDDGRKFLDVRPMYVNIGINSEARGSAYVELGGTKVICTVQGPREVTRREEFSLKGQLLCEFKYAPFARRIRQPHLQTNEEKEISRIIQLALEPAVILDKFPKARFDVFVIVLEDEGGALASSMTCCSMALVNAGISMYDIVIGTSLLVVDDTFLVDPLSNESSRQWKSDTSNYGVLTLGYMPNINQLSACDQKGLFELTTLQRSISFGIEICKSIHPVIEKRLKNSVREILDVENEVNST